MLRNSVSDKINLDNCLQGLYQNNLILKITAFDIARRRKVFYI